jgi:hypothetical protein
LCFSSAVARKFNDRCAFLYIGHNNLTIVDVVVVVVSVNDVSKFVFPSVDRWLQAKAKERRELGITPPLGS